MEGSERKARQGKARQGKARKEVEEGRKEGRNRRKSGSGGSKFDCSGFLGICNFCFLIIQPEPPCEFVNFQHGGATWGYAGKWIEPLVFGIQAKIPF
jgi:hypothetical protein